MAKAKENNVEAVINNEPCKILFQDSVRLAEVHVGDTLDMGRTLYKLHSDCLWWICRDPVHPHEVNYVASQVKTMTSVDAPKIPTPSVFKLPDDAPIGQMVTYLKVGEVYSHTVAYLLTDKGWAEYCRNEVATITLSPVFSSGHPKAVGEQALIHSDKFTYLGSDEWQSLGWSSVALGLPNLENPVPMPPVKASKPEEGQVTYSADAPDNTMEFRMGGATIAQIEKVQQAFPNMEHRGDGYFVLDLPAVGKPDMGAAEKRAWASIIYRGVYEIMQTSAPGHKPAHVEPVTEERQRRSFTNFLTQRLSYPGEPGSHENDRQLAVYGALNKHQETGVNTVIRSLRETIEQRDLTASEALRDPAIMALAKLEKVQRDNAKRKVRNWSLLLAVIALLVAVGVVGYNYVVTHTVVSNYTAVTNCKAPFGDVELEGKRFRTYKYKSLLGYRFGSDNDITTERTEVKLPGSDLTILGRDDEKAKPWRLTYVKGDYGTAILKPSDQYWFVGNNDRTTLVNYNEFCH